MINILLLAPPAAGKGTQSELLEKQYGIMHISTGNLLREASMRDDSFGNSLKEILKTGKLVSDEIVLELLNNKFHDVSSNGFLLDGFPRNINQAIELDKILKESNLELDYVFFLDVDSSILEKRITGRRLCEDCHAIYNINDENSSPKVESVCDKCGGKLYQRNDDNLEAFQTRYQMYLEKTAPIIEHYKKQNVLHVINGEDTVENIFNAVDEIISNN